MLLPLLLVSKIIMQVRMFITKTCIHWVTQTSNQTKTAFLRGRGKCTYHQKLVPGSSHRPESAAMTAWK